MKLSRCLSLQGAGETGLPGPLSTRNLILLLSVLFLFSALPGQAEDGTNGRGDKPPAITTRLSSPETLAEKWGVELRGIRLSAAGHMLDFRYRVLDPEKAREILDPKSKPYLIDEATGAKFIVPTPPKIGSLRNKSRGTDVKASRTYFIIFANPGGYVKKGSKITVVVGDFRAEGLVVE